VTSSSDEMIVRAAIRDELSGPLEDIRRELHRTGEEAESAGRKASVGARGFDAMAGGAGRLAARVGGTLVSAVKYGTAGLVAMTGAAVVLGVRTAASMETAAIGFETMLGSGRKARKFLDDLKTFAASTPFEFPELVSASSSLISAGIDAGKVIPIMRTLGDVTSGMGTGSEGIQRATIAIQQMTAAGKVNAEDLNQLRDAGIPVYDLLAAAIGKTKSEVVALASSGDLGGDVLAKMMHALETGKGLERFSGLMEKQSQTLTGVWSTLKDTVQMGLADALQPAIPILKQITTGASDLAVALTPRLATALHGAIQVGVQMFRAFKDNGLDGVADVIERRFGPNAAHVFNTLRGVVLDLRKAFAEAVVPVAKWKLEHLAQMIGFLADHTTLLKIALFGLVTYLTLAKVASIALAVKVAFTTGTIGTQIVALRAWGAAMLNTSTRSTALGIAALKVASAAKMAAGVGGIMALTSSLGNAKSEGTSFSNVMLGAAGGAGIGAMFGPIGMLVGAAAGGGLTALAGAFGSTKKIAGSLINTLRVKMFSDARADADKLTEALHGVIGAYGDVGRAAVKAGFVGEDGKLEADIAHLREMGVSMDTIVSATMGNRAAQNEVSNALGPQTAELKEQARLAQVRYDLARKGTPIVNAAGTVVGHNLPDESAVKQAKSVLDGANGALDVALLNEQRFGRRITETTGAIVTHRQQVVGLAKDLGITRAQYNKWPRKARTDIEANDLPETTAGILRLIGHYKGLQRFDRIKSLVSAPGIDLTIRQAKELGERYKLTPKQISTLVQLAGADKATSDIKRVGNAARDTDAKLDNMARPRRIDVVTYYSSVGTAAKAARDNAAMGGSRGDTATSRARSGSFAATMAAHARYSAASGARLKITNAFVGGGGYGRGSGDHQAGRALDLVGSGLGAYAREVRADGGYAELHGAGAGRHLHAVPAGDTSTSMARRTRGVTGGGASGATVVIEAGGVVVTVENPADNVDVAQAVRDGIRDYFRDRDERG
jgi:tape measure domain-containing protein